MALETAEAFTLCYWQSVRPKVMSDIGINVRRLMARSGMTLAQVVDATGLHERTVKSLLNGKSKPHARTLNRLVVGLGVSADELFQNPSLLAHRLFDQRTNPVVDEVVSEHPDLFDGWTEAEFAELYSRFGTGGSLTAPGTLAVVAAMNQKRDIHQKVALLLESGQADLLAGLVDLLYQKILVQKARD
jgi:transcriptional regulator with XRE-family HTH domain